MDQNEELLEENDGHDKVEEVNISSEMKNSFLNYAMSVIVARALPDARDGLKPVQRRILYGMNELGVYSNTSHKKSARIVGDVMGKYHPHGDSSIYDAMVRMAQPFSYRYMLVDGHGNFGSVDGDGAAAMRYTEARMSKISMEMLKDISKNTVDFIDNYDGTEREPAILPSRYPNLLVNGSTGIAVGMATNIPPHNLGEVIDGTIALMDNPELTCEDLMDYIKGPDFPTGGQVLGLSGLRSAYNTGNGSIVIRSKAEVVEAKNGKQNSQIIVTEIPYMVNKTRLIERIAAVHKEKIVDGIADLRDESNRNGMRIVIEVRKDANANVVLNNLFKYTQLQSSYGINMIALVNNKPIMISLKTALEVYIKHQIEVITRRTQFDLDKALNRLHILEGLMIALHGDNIDLIIQIIRNTKDGTEKEKLIEKFNLSEVQATAILDMQLKRLSGLNKEKTETEYNDLIKVVEDLRTILASEDKKKEIIKQEMIEIRDKFADERRSEISLHVDLNIENEDLIPVEDVVITITNKGYAKRMRQDVYKSQSRGGVGVSGIKTSEDDIVEHILPTSTHDYILFFTNKGRVYKMKGYQVPEGSRVSKGLPIVNLLKLEDNEKLAAITTIKDFEDENAAVFFATKRGTVKRTLVSNFQNIRSNGIIAISLDENDELLQVEVTDGNRDIILGASNGKAIRFAENTIRPIGRTAAGVRGMRISDTDEVVGMAVVTEDNREILVITEKGYGKRSDVDEYRTQTRGGMGVKTLNVTDKNGKLKTLRAVNDNQDLIVTTNKGVVIRMHVGSISQTGRATQGVKLIRLREDQEVSTIALVEKEIDENLEIETLETETQIVEEGQENKDI